jgi:hypothetical protein
MSADASGGPGRSPIPRTDLLRDLRRAANALGHAPSKGEYRRQGEFSTQTYRNRFGSWLDALKAAGIDPRARQVRACGRVERVDLARDIRRVANDLGHAPAVHEYQDLGTSHKQTVYKRFGSWFDALAAAGLEPYTERKGPSDPPHKLDDEQLIEDLQAGAVVLGRPPTSGEYQDAGEHSFETLIRHFGSYADALEAAGLDDGPTAEEIEERYLSGTGGGG